MHPGMRLRTALQKHRPRWRSMEPLTRGPCYHRLVETLPWLLESDPAIRWQVLRDLADASPNTIAAERARIPHQGLGAAILAAQQPDGAWRCPDRPAWLSTLFTLLLLRSTGIDPADPLVQSALSRAESNLRWNDEPGCWDLRPADFRFAPADGQLPPPHGCKPGGNPFYDGEEEPCINGGVLAFGSCFGHPSRTLAARLLAEQLPEGGWNCEAPKSQRASFHTTICVLEGLLEFERAAANQRTAANQQAGADLASESAAARQRAHEYLLERSLFRRRSTDEIANAEFLQLAFPPRYHYDAVRALDYFRAAGVAPDPRMNEAIHYIESRRQTDGSWLLDRAYNEAIPVRLDESVGEPSRWNTLRALRVLRWFHGSHIAVPHL